MQTTKLFIDETEELTVTSLSGDTKHFLNDRLDEI